MICKGYWWIQRLLWSFHKHFHRYILIEHQNYFSSAKGGFLPIESFTKFECNYYSPPLKYTARIFSWVKRAVKALLKLHNTYIFTKKCKKFSWLNDDRNPPRTDCSKKYKNTECSQWILYKHPVFFIFSDQLSSC